MAVEDEVEGEAEAGMGEVGALALTPAPPYSAEEVSRLRSKPLRDPIAERRRILAPN